MDANQEEPIVIGGGGLATALALHKKGLKSVVLERSESLRAVGSALTVHANGWRALHQLGYVIFALTNMGSKHSNSRLTLAEALPPETICFGCQVTSIHLDPHSSLPVIGLQDGSIIESKVLIGCDGANSIVADFLGLKPSKLFHVWVTRGITFYPNGHGFPMEFDRARGDGFFVGREPIDDKTLHWFVKLRGLHSSDLDNSKDPKLILNYTLESIKDIGLPAETIEMISKCNLQSLSITHVRYCAPWNLLAPGFQRGTVMVAGDMMHVMGPFIDQGGSSAMEDAIVLGWSLARKLGGIDLTTCKDRVVTPKIGEAIDEYVKERRIRLLQLSTQSYLLGTMFQFSVHVVKLFCLLLMAIFFKDRTRHIRFDCGTL